MTIPQDFPPNFYYSLAEASRVARISKRTLRRAIAANALPAHRLGRFILVKPSDLRAWIEAEPVSCGAGPGQ